MNPTPALNSGLASPFEQFFLGLGVLTGFPLVFGAPPPQSVVHLLSPVLVHVWAAFLACGCLTALIGTRWEQIGRLIRRHPRNDSALLIEQCGLVSAGVGTLIYGAGLVALEQPGLGIGIGIVFAYGLACFWRAGQIRRWIRAAIRRNGRG